MDHKLPAPKVQVPLFHCSAPALLPAYEMLCAAAFHPAQEDSAATGLSKRMNGKERKDKKRISRGNIHPGRVKPLSALPNEFSPLGPTRVPKQLVNIELLHSKLEPLNHNTIFNFFYK